jgi:hypothetical protein
MKLATVIMASAFAASAFSTAQACEYMNKTLTFKGGDKQQISQDQSPALPTDKDKLLVDTKKPISSTN